jgi:hypothetical protein
MAQKIIIDTNETSPFQCCTQLESGNILFFPHTPFLFPQEEIDFLLQQKQSASKSRKNIAYKPQIDKITNHDTTDAASAERLHQILRDYSSRVTEFLSSLLAPYAPHWRHDYASFRPFQEKGRQLRLRARNDLLHVDSFPTRPLHGARILRFFTNINPKEARRWITSQPFGELAEKYAGPQGIPFPPSPSYSSWGRIQKKIKRLTRGLGFKIPLRSPYDHFMLNFHNFLKENGSFQAECPKDQWDFPPNSCWAVFTDQVSHAALSGQYALEQTFLIPQRALLYPEKAPVAILERLSGRNMIDLDIIQ